MIDNQIVIDALLHKQQLALEAGNPPFAAVIECNGKILSSVTNNSRRSGNPLHHAEILAIQSAIEKYGTEILLDSHLFSSNEPCPMCTGACIWSGIPHVTYFLSQEQIFNMRGWGNFISAKSIASADDSDICINGPLGNKEMLQIHEKFWNSEGNSKYKHSIHLHK